MWNEVYSLVELIWPNSFHNTADPELVASGYKFFKAQSLHLLYFSFATLTTLGMEGVAPTSNTARMLVCAEAISGQVYITMLIARLVGMHIAEVQSARSVEGRE